MRRDALVMPTWFQLTVDCADPSRMTRFWAAALGYVVEPAPGGFPTWNAYWRSIGVPDDELDDELDDAIDAADSLVDPDGAGPRIWFLRVPEAKVVKNRVHLDLDAGGGRSAPLAVRKERVIAEVDRLAGLGAARLRVVEQEGIDHFAVVMRDPEGNEFCVH